MTPSPRGANVGVGILGASGYTGAELIRLLTEHPGARLVALGSQSHVSKRLGDVLPGLPHVDLTFDAAQDPQSWKDRGVDVVFAALPHGAFAAQARSFLQAGIRAIDLSADFRLREASAYPDRYHFEHPAADLLERAVYGLPEWFGDAVQQARFIANPGCYATAILLGALPALAQNLCSKNPIVVNAVSGVSGAGRAPKLLTHFVECGNSVAPYRVGEVHVHLGEIKQTMTLVGSFEAEPCVVFNPHLVPMSRGIVASIAIPLREPISEAKARDIYEARYSDCPFVAVLKQDTLPETRHVRGSNRCDIALRVADGGRMLLVFSAIDNLIKGAAGQAVQNWNLMQGWPETTGLPMGGWSCA